MSVFGYIFPGDLVGHEFTAKEQQETIQDFARQNVSKIDSFYIEEGSSLRRPFRQRKEGRRIIKSLHPGDSIIAMKAEWVLGSAREGLRLINLLGDMKVSLFCVDLKENLSLAAERKLVVYEGSAELVSKLLQALSVCESSQHGESIKSAKRKLKREGKYLGGPVPFGWQKENGYLVRDPAKQKVIEDIKKLREDRWSYRDIVGILKEKYDIRLSHEGIRRALLNSKKL